LIYTKRFVGFWTCRPFTRIACATAEGSNKRLSTKGGQASSIAQAALGVLNHI